MLCSLPPVPHTAKYNALLLNILLNPHYVHSNYLLNLEAAQPLRCLLFGTVHIAHAHNPLLTSGGMTLLVAQIMHVDFDFQAPKAIAIAVTAFIPWRIRDPIMDGSKLNCYVGLNILIIVCIQFVY